MEVILNAPVIALFTVIVALSLEAKNFALPNASKGEKPLLLAFYHPWYGTPWGPSHRWRKWDSWKFSERYNAERVRDGWRRDIASADYPLIGPYDVSDPEVVRWHFRLAKAAGIDGLLCSWWKFPKPDSFWDWQYHLFDKVWLPVAQEENFALAVIDECAHYVRNYDALITRVTGFLPRYAAHPAYLHINGEPVWFVYQVWDDWLTAEQAARYLMEAQRSAGKVFWIFDKMKATATKEWPGASLSVRPEWQEIAEIDCFGAYSLFADWRETKSAELEQLYRGFADKLHSARKAAELPILPGHDNSAVNEAPYIVPRQNGLILSNFLQAVDSARPEIAVVCSFNEWFEMTQIEPSINWSDPYLYLKIIAQWRGKKWHAPPLPPATSLDKLIEPRLQKFRAADESQW
jgi:glycosyl hydrolase family 99